MAATFASPEFSSADYAKFRPTYSPKLLQTVLKYHHDGHDAPSSPTGTLLDLGCGPGLVARGLAPSFSSVIAIDPSESMVSQAKALTTDPKITIRQGTAEDLSALPDSSIDCVVSGQAAHWFDFDRAWPELGRVVKSGGTLAFWGYKDHLIVGQPAVTAVFDRFTYGETDPVPGMKSLLGFWERRGGDALRDSYRGIVPPPEQWRDVKRVVYDLDHKTSDISDAPEEALWLRRSVRLGDLADFVRTYSSFIAWKKAHPDRTSRADGGPGDIVDVMFDHAVDAVPEWKSKLDGDQWKEIEVDVVWATVLLMAKRK